MKKRSIAKITIRIAIILVSIFLALPLAAWAYNTLPSPGQWLPTHSYPGVLRLAANDGSVGHVSVSLVLEDGSRYTLNADPGVITGEPQHYALPPEVLNKRVKVHLAFDDYDLKRREMDVMYFSLDPWGKSVLERNGLLIYFSNTSGISFYVISGLTRLGYVYSEDSDDWAICKNPPLISHYPSGMGANSDWYSGWKSNTWKYIPADSASKDQQK